MTLIKTLSRGFTGFLLIGLFLVPGSLGGFPAYAQDESPTTDEPSGLVFTIPPQPDWPDSEWRVGSALTYQINVGQDTEPLKADIRLAILDSEVVATETLYWIEIDISNISGLSADDQAFFLQNYGEIPDSVRLKMEIPEENLIDIILDPAGFYKEFSAPGYVEKMIFQYNRQVPWDVDPALIGGWILPMGITMLLEGNLPDDFYDTRNIGVKVIQDPDLYNSEFSDTSITVEGGDFECSEMAYTSMDDTGGNGTVFYTEELPIVPLIMVNATWAGQISGTFDLELIEFLESGATSEIVGEPVDFNLQTLMQMGM